MKRNTIRLAVAVMAMSMAFSACKKDEGITMPNSEEITQTAYADEGNTGKGFTFTAKGDWTATVKEVKSSEVSWLKLLIDDKETYNGKAWTFTMVISLEANNTGVKRSATIEIVCGKEKITVSVTQEETTQGGEVFDGLLIDLSDVIPSAAVTLKAIIRDDVPFVTADVAQTKGKILLPATLSDNYLKSYSTFIGVTASVSGTKLAYLEYIGVFNTTNESIGICYSLAKSNHNNNVAAFIYSDRDCNFIGTDTRNTHGGGDDIYKCYFKKGWNIMYYIDNEPSDKDNGIYRRLSTTKPEGRNFNWVYESFN